MDDECYDEDYDEEASTREKALIAEWQSDLELIEDQQLYRSKLIEAVVRRILSSWQAEELAQRRRCGPLASTPRRGKFDARNERLWTLPMAFAWIQTRRMDMVEQHSPQYLANCLDWDEDTYFASEQDEWENIKTIRSVDLKPRQPVTLHDLSYKVVWPGIPPQLIAGKEKNELIEALQDGTLMARGIKTGTRLHDQIPADAWITLAPFQQVEKSLRQTFHDAVFINGEAQPSFVEVRVVQKDVLSLWPPHTLVEPPPKQIPAPLISDAPPAMRQLNLEAAIHSLPTGLNRDQFHDELKKRGSKISRDQAWRYHKEIYTGRPKRGRPKKIVQ